MDIAVERGYVVIAEVLRKAGNAMSDVSTVNYKSSIPISPLCLTSHFMCVQIFHMVNIDVPAGVGAPPLDTQLPKSMLPSSKCPPPLFNPQVLI